MAKGKRSNSPKRSRRGGKRSPKKSKQGVQKKISKSEAESAQLHDPKEVEEPDCECQLDFDEEEQKELPKNAEVPVADVTTFKADLVQFFWDSLEEDARAGLKSMSELPENRFFFGTVAAEIAKTGKFTDEVESQLAAVWKADELWVKSFLAGEVEPAKPEEPEEPEAVEPAEIAEEVMETAEAEPEATMEAEVAAEVAAEAPVSPEVVAPVFEETAPIGEDATEENPEVEDVAMEGVVDETVEAKEPLDNVDVEGSHVPESMEELVSESALNKENTANVIAEAVKTISAKIGEQPEAPAVSSPLEGLAPKDLNVVAPTGLA